MLSQLAIVLFVVGVIIGIAGLFLPMRNLAPNQPKLPHAPKPPTSTARS
jgi:hypothetical protein